ncbi:FecR family protein [Puteibacter caeruleilacunae]|nr:FecR family protein [Puteibacter caeruleilacunae]
MSKKEHILNLLSEESVQDRLKSSDVNNTEEQRELIDLYDGDETQLEQDVSLMRQLRFKHASMKEEEIHSEWGALNKRLSKGRGIQLANIWSTVQRIAAILIIPLLITSIYFYTQYNTMDQHINKVAQIEHTVYAPLGGKTMVVLPDGSRVWLNAGSELKYPQEFNLEQREVELSGEAFFDVEKMDIPMLVKAGEMDVKVFGTEFNVYAYPNEDILETQLVSGKVSVISSNAKGKRVSTPLIPGRQAVYSKQKKHVVVSNIVNLKHVAGWRNNLFAFKDEPFKRILNTIERNYNVEIVLEDETIGEASFNGIISSMAIERVMEIFAYSLPITYEIEKVNGEDDFTRQKITIKRDRSRTIKK